MNNIHEHLYNPLQVITLVMQFTLISSQLSPEFCQDVHTFKLEKAMLTETDSSFVTHAYVKRQCPIAYFVRLNPNDGSMPSAASLRVQFVLCNTADSLLEYAKRGDVFESILRDPSLHGVLLLYCDLKRHVYTHWLAIPFPSTSIMPFPADAVVNDRNIVEDEDATVVSMPWEVVEEGETTMRVRLWDAGASAMHPSVLMKQCYWRLASSVTSPKQLQLGRWQMTLTPLDRAQLITTADLRGWERNSRAKLRPRQITMKGEDPAHAAEEALRLNLSLMLWRANPSLQLAPIAAQKCVLFGMGTLGCQVARTLVAWGVRHLVLIDSGVVAFSNPPRQSLYTMADAAEGRPKVEAAACALKAIAPSLQITTHQLVIPMPGHPPVDAGDVERLQADTTALYHIVQAADALFLLTDSREARWLPTALGQFFSKRVLNAGLAYDSYLVMRHGTRGCYFCADLIAPMNSMRHRAMDQQCTVTRPGLAAIASSLVVELFAAWSCENGALGQVPHRIRGSLLTMEQVVMNGERDSCCVACSEAVIEGMGQNLASWQSHILAICQNPLLLSKMSGLDDALQRLDLDFEEDLLEM